MAGSLRLIEDFTEWPPSRETPHPHKTLKNNNLKRATLALRLRLAWFIFRVLPATTSNNP